MKETKKRPPRKNYDRKMIQKVVDEYREGQHLVTKVTYTELEEKYQIPASTNRGYHRKEPSGTMPVKPAPMGRKCVLEPADEEKLVNYLLRCCDRGYGKNRM